MGDTLQSVVAIYKRGGTREDVADMLNIAGLPYDPWLFAFDDMREKHGLYEDALRRAARRHRVAAKTLSISLGRFYMGNRGKQKTGGAFWSGRVVHERGGVANEYCFQSARGIEAVVKRIAADM